MICGKPGSHCRESGCEGNGHGGRRAPTGRRLAGSHHVHEAAQRQLRVVGYGICHESPTTSPLSSKSMRVAAGVALRPGIVRISPQRGEIKPAPTEARTSRTGSVQPFGAPTSVGSEEIERCVFAMHTGNLPKPLFS